MFHRNPKIQNSGVSRADVQYRIVLQTRCVFLPRQVTCGTNPSYLSARAMPSPPATAHAPAPNPPRPPSRLASTDPWTAWPADRLLTLDSQSSVRAMNRCYGMRWPGVGRNGGVSIGLLLAGAFVGGTLSMHWLLHLKGKLQ